MNTIEAINELLKTISIKRQVAVNQHLSGISMQQSLVLGLIAKQPGLLQKDIVAVTKTKPASVSSFLKTLEGNNLIIRKIPADNNRNKEIYLTAKGQAVVERFNQDKMAFDQAVVQPLSDEQQQQLVGLLTQITAHI